MRKPPETLRNPPETLPETLRKTCRKPFGNPAGNPSEAPSNARYKTIRKLPHRTWNCVCCGAQHPRTWTFPAPASLKSWGRPLDHSTETGRVAAPAATSTASPPTVLYSFQIRISGGLQLRRPLYSGRRNPRTSQIPMARLHSGPKPRPHAPQAERPAGRRKKQEG